MNTYNCIIVDDEEIDRLLTFSFVSRIPFLTIIDCCETADEALALIQTHKIDVLFLDIDMPELDGFALRRKAQHIPACIYITSHPEHALESYETIAFDFIVKPVYPDRFMSSMRRLEEYLNLLNKAHLLESRFDGSAIMVKKGHDDVKLNTYEVIYLESLREYTKIVTSFESYPIRASLSRIIKEHDFQDFVRIHRSFAVNKSFVNSINKQEVLLVNNIQLPVGRTYKDSLKELK
jgi:two-component system LytT family response regulator